MKKIAPITPGEVLLEEFLEPLGVTPHMLAASIRVPPRRINEVVHGKRRISADNALRLGSFFGTTDRFWLNLQSRFDLEVQPDTDPAVPQTTAGGAGLGAPEHPGSPGPSWG